MHYIYTLTSQHVFLTDVFHCEVDFVGLFPCFIVCLAAFDKIYTKLWGIPVSNIDISLLFEQR